MQLLQSNEQIHNSAVSIAVGYFEEHDTFLRGILFGLSIVIGYHAFLYLLTMIFLFNTWLHAIAVAMWIVSVACSIINLVRVGLETQRLIADPAFGAGFFVHKMRQALEDVQAKKNEDEEKTA